MVNRTQIQALNPCSDRLNNYSSFYGEREFTKAQFMGLKNITHKDKLWVAFRLMPMENTGKAAGEIAKTVLHLYESECPNDMRPRLAVQAAISGTVTPGIINNAYDAYASASSYDILNVSVNVSRAARAARAAWTSAHFAYTATSYVDCLSEAPDLSYYTPPYVAYSAYVSATERLAQQKLIRKICLKYWKET